MKLNSRRMYLAGKQIAGCLLIAVCAVTSSNSQELVPRRWSHLPLGVNFAGGGYIYTDADIAFDPVLRIEDAVMNVDTLPAKYIRSFEFAGKSARFDGIIAYQDARWNGLLDGVPTSVYRSGFSDMSLRFAVNLLGAPPLSTKEFAEYRAELEEETIVGLGLIVQLPTGHYLEDKLLNLGTNRVTFRPQLGVVRNWGKLATEATISSWLYTDNNDFFGGNYLEQDPFYTFQGHIDYTFRPGLWVGAGLGYGVGGRSTLNHIRKDDRKENLAWVMSFSYPLSRKAGFKLAYAGTETITDVGIDSNNFSGTMSVLW